MPTFFVDEVNSASLSENEACNSLLEVAFNQHLAIENSKRKYYCVPHIKSKEYFVFQLHFGGGEPEDWIGSDLVGYYAIRKSDVVVLEWDVNDDIPGKVIFNSKQQSGK